MPCHLPGGCTGETISSACKHADRGLQAMAPQQGAPSHAKLRLIRVSMAVCRRFPGSQAAQSG